MKEGGGVKKRIELKGGKEDRGDRQFLGSNCFFPPHPSLSHSICLVLISPTCLRTVFWCAHSLFLNICLTNIHVLPCTQLFYWRVLEFLRNFCTVRCMPCACAKKLSTNLLAEKLSLEASKLYVKCW